MAQQTGEDNAKRARRHTERVIKSLRPPTRVGKLVVWAAPYVVGPAVEHGVRFAEERGPELAAWGAALAKEKVPAVAQATRTELATAVHTAREKAPVVAQAAKSEVVAAAHTVREKAPLVAHTAKEKAPVVARAAMDTVVLFAQRVQERRRSGAAQEPLGEAGPERSDAWVGDEERTGWEEGGR